MLQYEKLQVGLTEDGDKLVNNFRQVQPLNGRKVLRSVSHVHRRWKIASEDIQSQKGENTKWKKSGLFIVHRIWSTLNQLNLSELSFVIDYFEKSETWLFVEKNTRTAFENKEKTSKPRFFSFFWISGNQRLYIFISLELSFEKLINMFQILCPFVLKTAVFRWRKNSNFTKRRFGA